MSAGSWRVVERNNPLAVHALCDTKARADRWVTEVAPDYVSRGLFADKSLTADSFMVLTPAGLPAPWRVRPSVYERLAALNDDRPFPMVMGVTGGLEAVAGAAAEVADPGHYPGLFVAAAGCLDAPESMDAGCGFGTGRPAPRRWIRRDGSLL